MSVLLIWPRSFGREAGVRAQTKAKRASSRVWARAWRPVSGCESFPRHTAAAARGDSVVFDQSDKTGRAQTFTCEREGAPGPAAPDLELAWVRGAVQDRPRHKQRRDEEAATVVGALVMSGGKAKSTKKAGRVATRSSSTSSASGAVVTADVPTHIIAAIAKCVLQSYVGLEKSMPTDVDFMSQKSFAFTFEERTSLSRGESWADTTTFEQASKWTVEGRDEPLATGKQRLSKVPSPSAFSREMAWYKTVMNKASHKGENDIYLLYGHDDKNRNPPCEGRPLLFRHWEVEGVAEQGAITHCQSRGNVKFKRFGPTKQPKRTATEWVDFWTSAAPEYAVWGGMPPVWYSEPTDYKDIALKLEMFALGTHDERASTPAYTSIGEGGEDSAALTRRNLAVTFPATTSLLQTVMISPPRSAPNEATLPAGTPTESGPPPPPPSDQQPTKEGAAPASEVAPVVLADSSTSTQELPQREMTKEGETPVKKEGDAAEEEGGNGGAPGERESEVAGNDGGEGSADVFSTESEPLCGACMSEIEPSTEPFVGCNSTRDGKKKHFYHVACLNLVMEEMKSNGKAPKNALQLQCKEILPETTHRCAVGKMKIVGASNSFQSAELAREADLAHQRQLQVLKLQAEGSASTKGELAGARGGSSPVMSPAKVPAKEIEVVVLAFSNFPINPSLKGQAKIDKAETFLKFMKSKDIPACGAWLGPTKTKDMVPVYLALEVPAEEERDGAPAVLVAGARLLASQAREAIQGCYGATVQGKWVEGWAPVGSEGLVRSSGDGEPVTFQPIQVQVQIVRKQAVLDECPDFEASVGVPGRYVLAETCPLQEFIDGPMPRFIEEMFNPSFEALEAKEQRVAQHVRDRQQQERSRDQGRGGGGGGSAQGGRHSELRMSRGWGGGGGGTKRLHAGNNEQSPEVKRRRDQEAPGAQFYL